MATTDKESSVAGTDNSPPMLVASDYESWKIRIERYIRVTEGQGAAAAQVTRDKTDEEFTEIENNRELADIQATNILSQGLQGHVFNILNQTCTGKEIWDNVELLMKGLGKSLQQMKEELFDEYERFHEHQVCKQPSSLLGKRKAPGNVGTSTRGAQNYGQVTDNKEKLVICYNCRGEGRVSRQCKEKKRVKDSQYFKDKMMLMKAKEKGAVLDAEADAFLADVECTAPYDQPLAITTTNIFEVSHEDTYDSDVDEGPYAATAFMANLSSTSGTNGTTTSHVNEVSSVSPGEISMITIVDDLRNQLDGHLKAKIAQSTLYDGHALLKPTNTPVRVHESEESLVQDEVSRTKMSNRPGIIKPINYAELNALYSHFVPQKELSREQVYWLPTEELATQKSNPPKPEQLQGKDDTIRKLQTQINIMSMLNVEPTVGSFDKQSLETELTQLKDVITSVRIQNDGFKVENVNLKRHYQELSTSNSQSRDTLTRKLTALTTENVKLKSKSLSKMHSEPIVPEKPKVLTPGMYAIRVKPATGASKPMSKSDTQNHSILPAKREKARRVEDHHRNLNKRNHVDSRLNVKRTGFVSNSNTVCNACNESLFFANHDNCVVHNLKYVNVKTLTAKHNVKTTKKV
nr:hypothetical protein [Tanacetum cinerariifolium]